MQSTSRLSVMCLKLRWSGVSDQWIKAVDEDLKGLTAVSAWATATCTAMVEKENPASVLLGRILVSAAIGMKK